LAQKSYLIPPRTPATEPHLGCRDDHGPRSNFGLCSEIGRPLPLLRPSGSAGVLRCPRGVSAASGILWATTGATPHCPPIWRSGAALRQYESKRHSSPGAFDPAFPPSGRRHAVAPADALVTGLVVAGGPASRFQRRYADAPTTALFLPASRARYGSAFDIVATNRVEGRARRRSVVPPPAGRWFRGSDAPATSVRPGRRLSR
jgi:hypothetical protein